MTVPPADREQWLGVELRHLATLAAVVEAGSFKGAARRLGYVQSAVSQQIAFLERCVGHQLVVRAPGPRPVTLTDPGAMVLAHAERILARLAAVEADLKSLATRDHAVTRVGIDPSISRRILPPFLRELRMTQPELEVVPVEIRSAEERLRLVEAGGLAAAFVDLPVRGTRFDAVELLTDPYVLLVPAGADLASLDRIPSLKEVTSERLLGRSAERVGTALPASTDDVPGDSMVQALVAAGEGAALVPTLALERDHATVALAVGDLLPPRVLGMCWHRDRRVDAVVAALRAAAERSCESAARGDHRDSTS
jgi:DNA-binding transcriptional LysR family regulator